VTNWIGHVALPSKGQGMCARGRFFLSLTKEIEDISYHLPVFIIIIFFLSALSVVLFSGFIYFSLLCAVMAFIESRATRHVQKYEPWLNGNCVDGFLSVFFCPFCCLLSMENIKYFPVILEWTGKCNWDMLTDYIYI
jgi:hypothetical protein